MHGCATGLGFANDMNSHPFEVFVPLLSAGMKKFGEMAGYGIDPCQIRTLVKIAIDAGEGEIAQFVGASVLLRHDVFDVQHCKRRVVLMQLTIFATISCALTYASPGRLVHLTLGATELTGLSLQNGDKLVCSHIALVFGQLFVGKLSLS